MSDEVSRIKVMLHSPQEARALEAIRHGQLARGPHLELLADELKRIFNRRYVVLTANGFSALLAVLKCLPAPKGGRVTTSVASTCFAMVNAIKAAGYAVQFADIDRASLSLANTIGESVDDSEIFVVPDHFGRIASLLKQPIEKRGIFIEDAAQAFISKSRIETQSDALVFSFYPTKWINGIDGGAVLTDDLKLFNELERLTSYVDQVEEESRPRFNLRMNNLHAAYALGTIEVLDEIASQLEKNFLRLIDISNRHGLNVCGPLPGELLTRFIVMAPGTEIRDAWLRQLIKMGVGASKELIWLCSREQRLMFPEASTLIDETFSLPFHPYLTEREFELIDSALAACG